MALGVVRANSLVPVEVVRKRRSLGGKGVPGVCDGYDSSSGASSIRGHVRRAGR